MGHDFTMDPKWQKDMEKMQEQLASLPVQMPDLPDPHMSWRNRALGIEAEAVNSQLAEFFGVRKACCSLGRQGYGRREGRNQGRRRDREGGQRGG